MKDDKNSDIPSLEKISDLPCISIEQLLSDKNKLPNEVFPIIWFVIDDKFDGDNDEGLWDAGKASQLSAISKSKKIKEFQGNNFYFAYLGVDKEGDELENFLKRIRRHYDLPRDKSVIFYDIFKSIIYELEKDEENTREKIIEKAKLGKNSLNNLEKNSRDIRVSTLEKLLLSKFVDIDIFIKFFIEKGFQLWKEHKGYTNYELQLEVDNNTDETRLQIRVKKKITFEQAQKKRRENERIGQIGEEYVNSYLHKLEDNGDIKSVGWVSRADAYSPHDFFISKNNTDIFIEVKSTRGDFESEIHISLNQLKEMSYDTKTYHIYRIFNIDEVSKTAKLRIAEDVKNFAKEILKVFKSLEALKVDVDSISVLPSNLNFQEEIKEIELLDE